MGKKCLTHCLTHLFTPFLYERNRTDQPNRCQLFVAELMPVYDRKLLKVLQVLR